MGVIVTHFSSQPSPNPVLDEHIKRVVAELGSSAMVSDYLRDFGELACVSVDFRSSEKWPPCDSGQQCKNPFCALLLASGGICTACLALAGEAPEPHAARSVKCLADLCETAVPVVLEEKVVAFLVIQPVLHRAPTQKEFQRALNRLRERGISFGMKELEVGYLASPVMCAQRRNAVLNLLKTFAEHLASRAQEMMMLPAKYESPAITRAREFIAKHQAERLSLSAVAKAAHMHPIYFCRAFKKATGFGFSEYVSRLRIERAKWLLRDRKLRISEAAFAVGFGSMAQFNRVFRKLVRQSPSAFRTK